MSHLCSLCSLSADMFVSTNKNVADKAVLNDLITEK
jgi:hypothetical protein